MPNDKQKSNGENGQTIVQLITSSTATPSSSSSCSSPNIITLATAIPAPTATTPSGAAATAITTASQIMANIINNSIQANTSGPSILKTKSGHSTETITAGGEDTILSYANHYSLVSDNYSIMEPPAKRKKRDPKTGKGLRHFSMKVCEKVKLKGTTTYNEVADELVAEFSADPIANRAAFQGGYLPGDQEPFDQKNIRRRVYDALNVLMAMNIISKEKKEIKWIGLPTNAAQECTELEQEKQKRLERIWIKKQQLRDLLLQQIAFKNLVERNKTLPISPQSNAVINLPFIVVNTEKKTVIDCSISNDKTEYLFNFDNTFEIHDDIEVLKRMGLAYDLERTCNTTTNTTTNGNNNSNTGPFTIEKHNYEKARSVLPEALRCELDEMVEEYQAKHNNNWSTLNPCTSQTSPGKLRH